MLLNLLVCFNVIYQRRCPTLMHRAYFHIPKICDVCDIILGVFNKNVVQCNRQRLIIIYIYNRQRLKSEVQVYNVQGENDV